MSKTAGTEQQSEQAAPLGWLPWTTLGLSIAGVAVAAYLTYEHFTAGSTLACPDTGVVNCLKVTSSEYSAVVGIPVALLGLGFFVAMTVLCLPQMWRATSPWPGRVRLAAVVVGVLFVFYLVWAELFQIDAICLWCTVVHALTLVLFGLVVVREALAPTST
ncbi:vitamin K epoxide reductase family protein [Kribbella sp. NBC_00889]|uniref:vitamin K epoxide reductase family protein n=1 Tax=Kribbella sp. NBC_00889 TaxID=2975974 RepID=UPI00386B7A4F|nr:vitamin K epoxide reductase family protein [Kribbella sp. NBC_00889]